MFAELKWNRILKLKKNPETQPFTMVGIPLLSAFTNKALGTPANLNLSEILTSRWGWGVLRGHVCPCVGPVRGGRPLLGDRAAGKPLTPHLSLGDLSLASFEPARRL